MIMREIILEKINWEKRPKKASHGVIIHVETLSEAKNLIEQIAIQLDKCESALELIHHHCKNYRCGEISREAIASFEEFKESLKIETKTVLEEASKLEIAVEALEKIKDRFRNDAQALAEEALGKIKGEK